MRRVLILDLTLENYSNCLSTVPTSIFFEMHKPLRDKVLFGMRSGFDFNDDAKTMCGIISKLHSVLPDFQQR